MRIDALILFGDGRGEFYWKQPATRMRLPGTEKREVTDSMLRIMKLSWNRTMERGKVAQ